MTNRIKGITVEIGGDTTKGNTAYIPFFKADIEKLSAKTLRA